MRVWSDEAIKEKFNQIKEQALCQIKLSELEAICANPSMILASVLRPEEINFLRNLKAYFNIPRNELVLRQEYLIDNLLPLSRAANETFPTLKLQQIYLTTLPYATKNRIAAQFYCYNRLDFKGAQLEKMALINAVRGGADITEINWATITTSEKKQFLILQEIVNEARVIQERHRNPRGIQELFNSVINPAKNIATILEDIQKHFAARQPTCWTRYCCFYRRDREVQDFYRKWTDQLSKPIQSTEPTTEETALLRDFSRRGFAK